MTFEDEAELPLAFKAPGLGFWRNGSSCSVKIDWLTGTFLRPAETSRFYFYLLHFAPASLSLSRRRKSVQVSCILDRFSPLQYVIPKLLCIGFSGNIWALKRITELSLCKTGLWWSK